jgi:UDP-N-acetylmuramate--alanine ligase
MSEIYYAGGSVSKDISSKDLINDISKNGKRAFFIEKRENFVEKICKFIKSGDVILLCGARDPSLSDFASHVFNELSKLKN